jgi:lipopolysaccharide exporter
MRTSGSLGQIAARFGLKSALSGRPARGGVWLAVGSSVEQLLRFGRNIILARILAPEYFGVMAIVLAVSSFFDSFTQIGIREAVIQNQRGARDTFLYGAWWFSAGRGALLYCSGFLAAPLIAGFYGDADLSALLRVAFLSLFFRGLMSSKAYVAVKDLAFKKWILIEQAGGVLGVLVSIGLTFLLHNVWALVIGFTLEALSQAVLSFIICPFMPRLRFDKDDMHSLLRFTRGMLGIPIFTFIFMRADVFLLGKLVSPAVLGLYSMITSLAQTPSLIMDKFFNPIIMPAFAEMQNDEGRIRSAILRMTSVLCLLVIPLVVFNFLYGRRVLALVYTPAYAQMAIPFAFLFANSCVRILNVPITTLYLALGKPMLLRLFTIMRALLLILLLYPSARFLGPGGAAGAVLVCFLISYFYQVFNLRRLVKMRPAKYWSSFGFPLAFSLLQLGPWLLLRRLEISGALPELATGICTLIALSLLSFLIARRAKLITSR